MVPCDDTGERCDLRAVKLFEENELAFEISFAGRLPGALGDLGVTLELSSRDELEQLTRSGARELLYKLQVINAEIEAIRREEDKRSEGEGGGVGRPSAAY